jgi:hypothetical protein
MSDRPFFTLVGEWPCQTLLYHTPTPWKQPPLPKPVVVLPVEKQWKLVDWLAEDTGLSRGKIRKAVARGLVTVDGVIELDADRTLSGIAQVVMCSTS